jgi:hypothetical protein
MCFRFVQLSLKYYKPKNYILLEHSVLVIHEVPDSVFWSLSYTYSIILQSIQNQFKLMR